MAKTYGCEICKMNASEEASFLRFLSTAQQQTLIVKILCTPSL